MPKRNQTKPVEHLIIRDILIVVNDIGQNYVAQESKYIPGQRWSAIESNLANRNSPVSYDTTRTLSEKP